MGTLAEAGADASACQGKEEVREGQHFLILAQMTSAVDTIVAHAVHFLSSYRRERCLSSASWKFLIGRSTCSGAAESFVCFSRKYSRTTT